MIVSAIALWKKFNLSTPLSVSEWDITQKDGVRWSRISFSGHEVEDGVVRVYARFCKPDKDGKHPAVLLLPDAGAPLDEELCAHFVNQGYAVLMPDYSGKLPTDTDSDFRTIYPPSLEYGNFVKARGLTDMENLEADQTTWFEWLYVALFAIEFLKAREDIGKIGIVGVRHGGDLAWQAMLSPTVSCGVPINAVGWKSFSGVAKFSDSVARNLSDDVHRYIAAVEAQSYAPSVKCPVLMLCAVRLRQSVRYLFENRKPRRQRARVFSARRCVYRSERYQGYGFVFRKALKRQRNLYSRYLGRAIKRNGGRLGSGSKLR